MTHFLSRLFRNNKHPISADEKKAIGELAQSLEEIEQSIRKGLSQGQPSNDLMGGVWMTGYRILVKDKIASPFNACLQRAKTLLPDSKSVQRLEVLDLSLPDTLDVHDYPLIAKHMQAAQKAVQQLRKAIS